MRERDPHDDPPRRREHQPATPVATLGQLQRSHCWWWIYCGSGTCTHCAPVALAPSVIRWGADASSDVLRRAGFNLLESHAAAECRFRNSPDDETVDELRQLTWDNARNVPTMTAGAIATLKYLGRTGPENACQEYCNWLASYTAR